MGFDPMTIQFIRLADQAKLGNGDPRCIDLVGDDVSNVNLGFHRNETRLRPRDRSSSTTGR